jgi:predicted permease
MELWYRVTASFRRRRLERDLDDEMAFHLAMRQASYAENGATAAAARRRAVRRFGNPAALKEQMRDMWTFPSLESIRQDVRYAVRNLRRQPGFTAVVVLVLATVIGLNTTLANVLAGVFLRPWPGVRDPSAVVRVYLRDTSGLAAGFSLADVRDLAGRTKSLGGVAVMKNDSVRLGSGAAAKPANVLMVSGSFFDVLGIAPARGRGFRETEDRLGSPDAVTVLGYNFWQSRFGGDAGVIGSSIRINDVPFTVIGVASRDFASSEPAYDKQLFLPIAAMPLVRPNDQASLAFLYNPDACCSDVVARLAPGATRAQAQAELDLLSRDFTSFSATKARGAVVTGTEFLSQPGRLDANQAFAAVSLLSAALMLVWLIACANIGNLMLARAAARVREIGIRLSLGASRRRLVRQLLTEGFVLALAASVLGIGVAYELPFIIFRIVAASGTTVAFPFSTTPDAVVLGYAIALAGLSAVAFGLAPALYATRGDVVHALNQRDGLPASRFPLRGFLLAVQVAVSVVLLVSAGLLVRGVQRQAGTFDPGFSVDDVSVVSFDLPEGVYDRPRATAFFAAVSERIPALPIEAFAFASYEPFSLYRNGTLFHLPGETREQARTLLYLDVSPGYFPLLRIPLLAGRPLAPSDIARPIVVVNESMAREYWPGGNPVGQTFFMRPRGPVNEMVAHEIVGIVRNVRASTSADVRPMFYRAITPGTDVLDFISADPRASQAPKLLLKAKGAAPAAEIARVVARLDPRVRVQAVPLAASLDAMLANARWGPVLAAALGAFALVLATVGMFGVFAYAVRQRTREIGIRMALGAQPAAVVRLVLAGHSRAVLAGVAVGVAGAIASSVVLRSRLHGLSPVDPISYLSVAALLACAGLAASYVPARRATRIDPIAALRCD